MRGRRLIARLSCSAETGSQALILGLADAIAAVAREDR